MNVVRGRGEHLIAMNRNGLIAIVDEKGREKERYHVVYGARLRVEEGQPVKLGQNFWPNGIRTRSRSSPKWAARSSSRTCSPASRSRSRWTKSPALSQLVVTLPPGDEKHQPTILVRDSAGRVRKKYLMPSRAHLMVQDGDEVQPGDVLAKIPRETTKTKDITGGLPRVVELFETRKPKDPAVISEIDGVVKYGEISKGLRKIYVESEDGEDAERIFHRPRRPHQRAGRRARQGRRAADRRPAQPARLAGRPRRKVHAGLPGERNSGGLPAAGRQHQRQAHRNHRSPDDALGESGRRRRYDVPARRAGG